MTPKAYVLRRGKQKARAILFQWVNGHTAKLRLIDPIGKFRIDNIIVLNFNTMEAQLEKVSYDEK